MVAVMDPVCGMIIDKEKIKHKTIYRGKIYYFCSAQCREVFERYPETYLNSGPNGMPVGTAEP
ncbi:MAG: YHS domain-containing protein [Thermofilaceae archaeon]